MHVGWSGEKVRLVPLEKARHFENTLRWVNTPELTQWTFSGDFPIGRLAEEEFFDKRTRDSQTDIVFAIETHAGEHIGLSGMHQIDFRHGTALTGTLIGRSDLWGQGYGADNARTRARYAFDVLGLRILFSNVMADNVASLRALLKCGYVEYGRVPQRFWKRGAYRDDILLMLTRETLRLK